jgi:hypothetical protein
MGLTIHYALKHKQDDAEAVKQTVFKMRQLALDLPFEQVGEVVDLTGDQCNTEARRAELQSGDERNEGLFWLLIQAGKRVQCPWNKRISRMVKPTRIIAFDTLPGCGSEPANFGLCQYPAEIAWEYDPEDDQRFQSAPREGLGWHRFDWRKWDRYCKKHFGRFRFAGDFKEVRQVPTKLAGWQWGSFVKTQYASDPQCGGVPNFLRCHVSVITLLDRMRKLPGLKVRVDDEGRYGDSTYADDWKEAHEAGRKPTYRRHKGLYSPVALAKEVGEWNETLAGLAGALSDALAGSGLALEAPIKGFPSFEQLEFRGRSQKHLAPFLAAMAKLAKATATAEPALVQTA